MDIRLTDWYRYGSCCLVQVSLADEAIRIGPPPAVDSYLRGDIILEAAKRTGAQVTEILVNKTIIHTPHKMKQNHK